MLLVAGSECILSEKFSFIGKIPPRDTGKNIGWCQGFREGWKHILCETKTDIFCPLMERGEGNERREKRGMGPGWRKHVVRDGGKPRVLPCDPSLWTAQRQSRSPKPNKRCFAVERSDDARVWIRAEVGQRKPTERPPELETEVSVSLEEMAAGD